MLKTGENGEKTMQKDAFRSSFEAEPRRRKPTLRRSSSASLVVCFSGLFVGNVAASKLAALQEEYEEKFEHQRLSYISGPVVF